MADDDLLSKLSKELREAGQMLDRDQARFLVTLYYETQEHRIALNNQKRTLDVADKPSVIVAHFADQMTTLEKQMIKVLERWTMASDTGRWSRAQLGVGPVLAAGLMAHIDITRAPTVSHIWRFAGLDPTFEWLGRERAHAVITEVMEEFGVDKLTPKNNVEIVQTIADRTHRKYDSLVRFAADEKGRVTLTSLERALSLRPWNAELKVLCWKLGDSFVKSSTRPNAYYGRVYRQRKLLEQQRNDAGQFAEQAADTLKKKNIRATNTLAAYKIGKLPPGRLDLRARRYAVKLFLAHWHEIAYREHFDAEPPAPYAIAFGGHADYLPPPPGVPGRT